MLSFEAKLRNLATVLVQQGVNVQKGEHVLVVFQEEAEELALLCATMAYGSGAAHVTVKFDSQVALREQLSRLDGPGKYYIPDHERACYDDIVDRAGCVINLRTNPLMKEFEPLSQEVIEYGHTAWETAKKRFLHEGINKGKVAWTLAYPPSVQAAKKIFPGLAKEVALRRMWQLVFSVTMCQTDSCLELWSRTNKTLHERARKLNELSIRELRFVGPGTDLHVGLDERSRWITSNKQTASGKWFTSNIPSYEVFTTPHKDRTNGFVEMTRPINIGGAAVEGLRLTFERGKLVSWSAKKNGQAFRGLTAKDEGASYLGEVALVAADSPIARAGVLFYETLYDENAACHIALGSGYAAGIEGGWQMSTKELTKSGLNRSVVHQDMMISNLYTDVFAFTRQGDVVDLMREGMWTKRFQ